jgi:hypothetical protein
MSKQLGTIACIVFGVLALLFGLIAIFSSPELDVAKNLAQVTVLVGICFVLVLGSVTLIQKSKNDSTKKPMIRMCFTGQEFTVEKVLDLGDHWKYVGRILQHGSYSGVPLITFRIPKGVMELRLGYYMNYNYVLVDVSNPKAKGARGYLANTDRVEYEVLPFPQS